MDKVILVDKPKEWTSFDVVAKTRSFARQYAVSHVKDREKPKKIKVGHAGTLDPLATGLLIILVGDATKQQDAYMKQDKEYEVTARIGETSTTGDAEGDKTHITHNRPSIEALHKALEQFTGVIQQIPPQHSAIKIAGKRAYSLARAGKDVKLEPRTVTVHSISNVTYNYPELRFTTVVSSGTYIRSLVADIGEALGTGAYMSELRRTKIGSYRVENALKIEELSQDVLQIVT